MKSEYDLSKLKSRKNPYASKLKKRKIKDQEIIDTVKALMENVSSEEDEEL